MNLPEALIQLLRGAVGIGHRVYLNQMPNNNVEACIVLDMVNPHTAPEGGIHRDTWQVSAYTKGRTANGEAIALMQEVESRLHRWCGVVSGLHIQRIMAQNEGGLLYENNEEWWHAYREFAITYTTLGGR